jgi:PAS domain S-box-containing protein
MPIITAAMSMRTSNASGGKDHPGETDWPAPPKLDISNQRFQVMFENASVGMAITDPSGILAVCNEALCTMLGYSRDELQGKRFSEVTHPDDQSISEEQLRKLVSGQIETTHFDKRYLHRDGHVVWTRMDVSSVVDDSGRVLHFVAHIDDISPRKLAEAAATASEAGFRLAFESAASGMALIDPATGRFLKVNQAGCEMLGYSQDEILGLTIQDVTAPADREESFARFRCVISGVEPSSRAKLHYLRSDGSTAYAIVSTSMVKDSEGHPLYMVANVVDITEQVEAQDELAEIVASKDQLIASVSHELRTPLTAILGFAELLRGPQTSLSTQERVELVQSIATQTGDLTNIVEDLLVAARADDNSLVVTRVPVDLRAQAAQVLETIDTAGAENVGLSGDGTRGWGDPARVRQILRNLISNAFRYGGEGVEVTTYADGKWSCLEVIDDGDGVPTGERDLIFEPYQRAQNSVGLTASIGLGLTVSRKLADLMGGTLTYRFENGRSVFRLALTSAESA